MWFDLEIHQDDRISPPEILHEDWLIPFIWKTIKYWIYAIVWLLVGTTAAWVTYDLYKDLNSSSCDCYKKDGKSDDLNRLISLTNHNNPEKKFEHFLDHLWCIIKKPTEFTNLIYANYNPKWVEKVKNFKDTQVLSTTIYDVNWKVITVLRWTNYSNYTPLSQIPESVRKVFLRVEDGDFYNHGWIEILRMLMAGIANMKAWKIVQWWSTIDMQLAKLLIIWDSKQTYLRKVLEVLYAWDMERVLSKDQILETWLNILYFWNWIYWIWNAAKFYYWIDVKDLSILQSATLVWVLPSPNNLNPLDNSQASLKKRNIIIKFLYDKWLITVTDGTIEDLYSQELNIVWDSISVNHAPWAVDYISQVFQGIKWRDITKSACEVHTTIDIGLTEMADYALKSWYIKQHAEKYYRYKEQLGTLKRWTVEYNKKKWEYVDAKKRYESVIQINWWMVVTNPHTWEIRAIIWWMDYEKSPYNRVTQSERQVWSIMKILNALAALENWISQDQEFLDEQFTLTDEYWKPWSPKNWEWSWEGSWRSMKMEEILLHSLNLPMVRMVMNIWFPNYFDTLRNFWVDLNWEHFSVSLWSLEMTLLQISKLFSIVSNWWYRVDNKIIKAMSCNDWFNEEFLLTPKIRVATEENANIVMGILWKVVKQWSWRSANVEWLDVIWKTWTTNSNTDVLFVSAARLKSLWLGEDLQLVVRLGNDSGSLIYKKVFWSNTAAPVVWDFFRAVFEDNNLKAGE